MLAKPIKYVAPYSPEAYNAAKIISQGGTGTPYTPSILAAARRILAAQ